jgi:two-component system sensor histidine kinase UhpB
MGVFDVEFLSGKGTWSPKLFAILGLPPEFQPRTSEDLTRLIHPEDRTLLDRMMVEMIDGKPVNHEFRVHRPDGEMRWVDVCGQRKADGSGESIRFVGTCVDITERKREEQEKQRAAQRFRALAARLQRIREEERTRAAREIHDELGQAMTAIKLDLARLIRDLPAGQQESFLPILETADQAVDAVRRIARELRPGILDASGLGGAVEWAASEFAARTGIKCDVNLPSDEIQMHPDVTTALFRILQEALTNIARHSEAGEAQVTLADEDDRVVMEIQDDGKGISNEVIAAADSLGILGMRERALLLGGELFIHGAAAEGTTLRIVLPKAASSRPRAPR